MPECFKDDVASQWKGGKFDPRSLPQFPNRWSLVTKLGMGDDIWDAYPYAKFHYDPMKAFCSPCTCVQSVSASYFFFGGGEVLRLLYSQIPCTDFYDQYVKLRRFAQGCAFCGPENKILHFDPISQKTLILGTNFDGDKKLSAQKGLNNGDVPL